MASEVERLADMLAGTKELVPWEHGEKVWLYCGKACKEVLHTVMRYGKSKPYALCGHPGCTRSSPNLPKRYRVTQATLEHEAARALPRLLARLAAHDAEVAARARAEVREAIGQRRDWIPCERVPELQAQALREAADDPVVIAWGAAKRLRYLADALAASQGAGESGEGER